MHDIWPKLSPFGWQIKNKNLLLMSILTDTVHDLEGLL